MIVDFEYTVVRRPKRRTAAITVSCKDNAVTVIVPAFVSDEQVRQLVTDKSGWIRNKLKFNEEEREKYQPKQFVDGEELNYLGKPCRLQIEHGNHNGVTLDEGILHVHILPTLTAEKRKQHIADQLTHWYKQKALEEIQKCVHRFNQKLGVTVNDIKIKSYKSRWGTCNNKGVLSFNWQIIMAPSPLVDYIVVHELCHLVHMNHSKRFWRLVGSMIIDYQIRKDWLKAIGNTLAL